MAKMYFDKDADLKHLENQTIGIIGYGNQGQAQALNLRDSGIRVIVGNVADASADQAVADGFEVYSIQEAAQKADILFLLLPDEFLPKIYQSQIAPVLRPNMVLNFASGYNITFNHITPPKDIDVILVAPRMIGKGVRETYLRGVGFPSLLGVHQDATGNALQVALALAKGIGSTRMGAMLSSFQEETVVDLFSEQSGDLYFPRMMFEVLVEAGYDPDVVLLELYASGEMSEMYAAVRDMGLWGQLKLHSRTSQYGQQITSQKFTDANAVKDGLRQVVEHIRSGEFSQEWSQEQEAGFVNLIQVTNENLQHPMQKAENRLYRLLSRRNKDLDSADWLEVSGE